MKSFLFVILIPAFAAGQTGFISYFTGNTNDTVTSPMGGTCLMGGATEDDEAMKWFLERCNGGDVLVLRASGSNGYNNYLYNQLGIPVNSVETIVFSGPIAANSAYVQQKITQAEGIWFAGGDQWNYVSYWRNTPVDSLINDGIKNRNIVIGGTSAGMAILGGFYFSAQNGSVTSTAALANPYNTSMSVDSSSFIKQPYMANVITDTHFDNPDRRGRLTTFMARILNDWNIASKAIACDEYTAVCIDTSGIARVFGGFPQYDDNAYFLQVNCELTNPNPEVCEPATPLTWNKNGEALKVYQIKGTVNGSNTFNLKTWQTGTGGSWRHWFAQNGTFNDQAGTGINCLPQSFYSWHESDIDIQVFPNPIMNGSFKITGELPLKVWFTGMDGKSHDADLIIQSGKVNCERKGMTPGLYTLSIQTLRGVRHKKIVVQ